MLILWRKCRIIGYILLVLISLVLQAESGHEVLYGRELTATDLKPSEMLIMQFDSRPLKDYWNTSAYWNKQYADHYGHPYLYLSQRTACKYVHIDLHDAWCKIKTMIHVDDNVLTNRNNKYFPKKDIKAVLFIDSDAVMTVNHSLATVISYIKSYHNWNMQTMPIAFNQDGPGFTCKHAMSFGFSYCLNSGTIFWVKSHLATQVLNDWWNSAGDPYSSAKYKVKFRDSWPWEQAQQYKIYDRYRFHIFRLSFPSMAKLPWTSNKNPKAHYPTDSVEPWCFSHWPGANCFITHHCASKRQKSKIIENFAVSNHSVNVKVYYLPS